MNISQVARQCGLPPKTIRYYEEIGLIRPSRTPSGYRSFSEADARRLAFLARARRLGFGIDECRALLDLYEDQRRSAAEVRRIAAAHLAEIDRRIDELRQMRAALADLVARCHGQDRPDCPIIDGLAGEAERG
ncbi:Cu(I)-responsive transcriptional regulator [Oceanicella actignis]|uniref:Cu(I)-responsive transcriptional regulator n=1 Tax=Oceanicella actignis TaxID=1189325 RepID=UPI0011E73058|nr:Cu(I)-responsive transcriptional regulator [Oceanicella actignis]TYO88863.1 Cu(I)-responsive transcriptional regulator [Oceanicella actignis]